MLVKFPFSPIETESKNSSVAPTAKNGRGIGTKSLVESTGNRIHIICETLPIRWNRIVSGEEQVSELMRWQLEMVANVEKRKEFTHQCKLIQSDIKKKRYGNIPTELVILLISHEWRKISKSLDRDQMSLLRNMAENVMFSIANSIRDIGRPYPVQSKNVEFRTTSSGMWYSVEYANGKGVLRLAMARDTDQIHAEVLRILRRNPGISEIRFPSEASIQMKRVLMDIISENRPLIGVLRIIPEWRVGTFMIRGVKAANDVLSQQTADKILGGIRQRITEEIDRKFGTGNSTRITASHNKITITLPKETLEPFPTQQEIDAIVAQVIEEKHDIIEESAKKYRKTPAEIKKTLDGLHVWGGESRVSKDDSNIAKLQAVYESEIHARWGVTGKESVTRMQGIQNLEDEFVREFGKVRFKNGLHDYPAVILDAQGKYRPHPLLLDIIRKPDGIDLIEPAELWNKVNAYLKAINRELDYIAPMLNIRTGFDEAKAIDQEFREGIISRKAFETTYKNSLSKSAFYCAIDGKKGACVMIDIKGMFTKNHNAFSQLSHVISETGKDVPLLERLDVIGNITRAFIRGTNKINRSYQNILCSHGGDEFMFFIEGATHEDIPEILKSSRNALGYEGFDIRASARESIASKEVFDSLDGETKIAKLIESIGRTIDGSIPPFLRHIEVSAETFSPDSIVNELGKRKEFIKHLLKNQESGLDHPTIVKLDGLQIRINRTWHDSIRIQAEPLLGQNQ